MAYSPRLGHNVGLGYVPTGNAGVGNSVTIEVSGGHVSGQIADKDWQCTIPSLQQ